MTKMIRKAVFPVAGLGTRFLPATKATPKEMMPLIDKPLIQYAVEEAIQAGITELIFVTSSEKRAIEDHFDSNFELEAKLKERKQYKLLNEIHQIIPDGVSYSYIRQKEALGLGHAILCAAPLIGNEPFAVMLADDFIETENQNCLKHLLGTYNKTQASVIAIESIDPNNIDKYGVVDIDNPGDSVNLIKNIIEKPTATDAPSNFGIVGRYILTPQIFSCLQSTPVGIGKEIQLTDAIATLLNKEPVYASTFLGKRYDCGTKLGYIEAIMSCALQHKELKDDVVILLEALLSKLRD